MGSFEFKTAQAIIVGEGTVESLFQYCQTLKMNRVLFVTDPGIVELGLHSSAIEGFEKTNLDCFVYSDVTSDPTEDVVLNALKFATEKNIDGVVGIGGGSSMDVAKLVAVLKKSEQSLSDIYGLGQVYGERLPLIQIPTTAGTGSEVTSISIVTTGEDTKAGIVSPQLLPDIAILDPNLTLGLPPHITAATGIDAMVHAIEAYTSKIKKNTYSDMFAREALCLLSANIKTAVHAGHDVQARTSMMMGATLAGQAFANSPVAAVHALAYPLGSFFHIAHGVSNALILPHVMRFNLQDAAHHYAEIAPLINPNCLTKNLSPLEVATQLISYIEALIEDLGLPMRLRELGIKKDDIPELSGAAMEQQRLLINNPRDVSLSDVIKIYTEAL